jgi:TolB-like protein
MPTAELQAHEVRRHLEKVLQAPGFARNERLFRLLRFIVNWHLEGRDHQLKESVIGAEVFGRRPDYDPKSDAIVRTEARRLRALLNEYYLGEGKSEELVIELPKGGYVPVIRRVGTPSRTDRPLSSWFGWRGTAVAGLVIVAVAAVGWTRFGPPTAPIPIAVLPLVNVSQDPAEDYFADGLTGELISNLSIIEGLTVRSQTSSFVFKGKPRNVREAGEQLHADYLLEGSVLRRGTHLRILTQLVRARDDYPLWSGRFERDEADVFAIQDEISRGIVNRLRLKLGHGRRRYETSADAYDLYLRARALETEQGLRGVNLSVGPFEQVIAKDPVFAPAYAGLAAAYATRTSQEVIQNAPLDRVNEISKMRVAVARALELDPLLAEAHDALGMVQSRDAQWEQAEKSFRHALELDSNDSRARKHLADEVLMPLGRIAEATEQLRLAERADPLAPDVQADIAGALIATGRFEEAAVRCEKLPATFPRRRALLARAMIGQGRINDSIHLLEPIFATGVRYWASDVTAGVLGYAYARAGRREEAEKVAVDLPNPIRALVFGGLGDKDRAFEALERSVTIGGSKIGQLLVRPELACLRGDPRLKALRKKVGLPEQHL